jgi:predicted MPP superfamily phosphohydrolase
MIEPRWLQRTRTRMHFTRLPAPLEGLRITLLTDFHAGRETPPGLIARAVDMTMREQPDLIAITGDIADSEPMLERTLDELGKLSAPLGVYIVPGNHDYRDVGIERWHDAVSRRHTLIDLTNRARFLNVPGVASGDDIRLCIAGADDLSEGRPHLNALHGRARRDFTILLAHNPGQAERARRGVDRVDLVLSGHTHGGQVRLPGYGAIVNSAERADLYEAGVRRRPWTQVYTSRGIGTVHLPVRFLARPEVAILTLSSEPRKRGSRWRRWLGPAAERGHAPHWFRERDRAGQARRSAERRAVSPSAQRPVS